MYFVLIQRTKVVIISLRSRLWLTWRNSLSVEYGASIASDFNDGYQCFGEIKLILLLWGYMGSASLKTSHPRRLSQRGKEYRPKKSKSYYFYRGSFILSENPAYNFDLNE
jgi:hypothetical protein